MKNWKPFTAGTLINRISALTSNLLMVVMMTVLMLMAGNISFAAQKAPMTPELAAKKEMVRKQREQRVTDAQRKNAAEALKAERLKVYKAKQLVNTAKPK